MAIDNLFDSASSVMTVISFTTFVGILWWTFSRSKSDIEAAAQLPFDDEDSGQSAAVTAEERTHV
ncbi:MAG: hypothetical protein RLZZ237_578 [Pseudomonadota bacterium]|jgi:cytochrome c oxidase cbb3-type subunit 4